MVGKAVDTTVPSIASRSAVTESAVMTAQYRHPVVSPVFLVVVSPPTTAVSDSLALVGPEITRPSIVMSLLVFRVQAVFAM